MDISTSAHSGRAATNAVYDLAEGVLWDDLDEVVRWVDIWKGRILAGRLDDGQLTVVSDVTLGQTAGAVALTDDRGLLVAAARGLATIAPNGTLSFGPNLLGSRTNVRLNDGSTDLFGAFVVGSLSQGERTDTEVLLRVFPNGRVETLREGVGLSNGIAFSPDGGIIYHVDTFAGTVAKHSYGAGPFDSREPWVTVLDDLPSSPDGLTIDSAGALWVALWGGSAVHRFSPAGELLGVVNVNAAQVSCAGFVGPLLDTLAITSAQDGLTSFDDEAGAIFLADVGVTGLPAHRWSGSTTTPYWLVAERERTR